MSVLFTDLCKKGKLEEIKAAMRASGFDVNQRSKAGKTGLMHAAKEGEKATVQELVNTPGIDMNATDPKGDTALHWAIRNNEKQIAIILVKSGAKVDKMNNAGRTPLAMAQADGYGSDLNKARPIPVSVAPPRNAPVEVAVIKPYKPGSLAEVMDTCAPAVGDICINPEYYCDTVLGPGCMNNCITCNSSLFNSDCYWDSQSYIGRNCSTTSCESGVEWALEFSLHLYSLVEAGVYKLIDICQDLPDTIEKGQRMAFQQRTASPAASIPAGGNFVPVAPRDHDVRQMV